VVNFIYDIPLFRNNSSRLGEKTALGGWQASGTSPSSLGLPSTSASVESRAESTAQPTNRPTWSGKIS